jgi:hypothetical protein
VPGNPITELTAPLRVCLEQLIPPEDRLCLRERAIGLCRRLRIFSECKLSSGPREIRRLDPKRNQTTTYARSDPVNPGAKLPSHPIGNRSIIQWIGAQPRPFPDRPVAGFCFHHDPKRSRTKRGKGFNETIGHRPSDECCLLEVLEWG